MSEVLGAGEAGDPRALLDAEGRIAELEALLEKERAEQRELLALVSHELRTPTTVISGFSRLLLSERLGPLNSEQRRLLEESLCSCRRLDAFVGDLIQGARPGGEIPVQPEEASIRASVGSVVASLEPVLTERELGVAIDVPPAADRARFDVLRIEQVLTNLLGNAVRYAPAGSTIGVAARPRGAGAEWIEVRVTDAGPGIPERDRERIFEPFVRVGARQETTGLGLGLAICKRIVVAHGDTIRVEPAPGGGSCFVFGLPALSTPGEPAR